MFYCRDCALDLVDKFSNQAETNALTIQAKYMPLMNEAFGDPYATSHIGSKFFSESGKAKELFAEAENLINRIKQLDAKHGNADDYADMAISIRERMNQLLGVATVYNRCIQEARERGDLRAQLEPLNQVIKHLKQVYDLENECLNVGLGFRHLSFSEKYIQDSRGRMQTILNKISEYEGGVVKIRKQVEDTTENCKNCQTPIPSEAKFCMNCGNPVQKV